MPVDYLAVYAKRLLEAAIDQPHPTPELKEACQSLLQWYHHPARLIRPNRIVVVEGRATRG